MEKRTLMSVSVDANGWTNITPSSDTRTVYVSNSTGSDSNSGLSADSPVKSIAKGASLLRSGSPDWLLLKRGDVFTEAFPSWTRSGKDGQNPMVLSTYGTGDRPWLKTGAKGGFYSNNAFHDVAMIGLKFSANTRDPGSPDFTGTTGGYGFQIVAPINGLLVEDCSFDHYVYNMSFQGFSGDAKNIKIRRNEITDSYDLNGTKSEGLYASMTDGMLIEGNLFDHNGWNEQLPNSSSNVFSHNIYLWATNKNPTVKDNIIANAGSHGLQARGGGTITGNVFLNNPVGALIGNGSTVVAGGVTGTVSGNVFLEARDIAGAARGWAIEAGNIKPGGGTTISDNIIADDNQHKNAAIKLETDTVADNASQGVGINDLTIDGNIVYKWYQGLSIASGYSWTATNNNALNNITISNNDFQDTDSQKIINQPQSYNAAEENWDDNRYFNGQSTSGWFNLGGTTTSFDKWKSTVEPTAVNQNVDYPDPDRTVASYNASLGFTGTKAAFNAGVRGQDKSDWNNNYTAAAIVSYIRAGFSGATPSSVVTPPAPTPTSGTTTTTGGTTTTTSTTPTTTVTAGAPSGSLTSAPDCTVAGTSQYTIKVTYTDDHAVHTASFGNGDIKITGPNGYSQNATFLSADSMTDGPVRIATYVVAAPGGSWDGADNGTYTVSLNDHGICDVASIYAAAKALGTFNVNIPSAMATDSSSSTQTLSASAPSAEASVTSAPATVLWSTFDPVSQTLQMQFSKSVAAGLNASDLRLINKQTLELITNDWVKMTYDKFTNIATWTFTARVPSADYRVVLSGTTVNDADGVKLDGNGDGTPGDDYVVQISAAEMNAGNALLMMDPLAPGAW